MHEVNNYFFNAHLVRVALVDGEPRFLAADLARVLGYRDANTAIRKLHPDEKGTHTVRTPGGDQEMAVVTEPGLYSLVMGSRRPEAQAFKRWVTHEVLPSIRKTGSYQAAPTPAFDIPKTFAGALALAAKLEEERAALACAVQAQAEDIAILEPKAAFADRVAVAQGAHTISAAAKILGTGQNRLFAWLRMQGFLIEGTCTPYQQHVDAGLFKVVERVFTDSDGHDHVKAKTLVTGKGMIALQRRMDADVIRPLVRPQHTGISYLGAQA
jgi:anti-repressor protein